ncbi:hypothetical protein PR048_004618 [Dryococelus australis]|uniref:Uncharacterized protein n=1 Tax=Dryococelus australis TaxID=614101 RepID=A0ABQ9I5X5_9NEOP|nr:hypothetical protein PR048_004618 [Dryococelus australis]
MQYIGCPTFFAGHADVHPFYAAETVTRRRRLTVINQQRSSRHTAEQIPVVLVDAPVSAWVQSASVYSGAPFAKGSLNCGGRHGRIFHGHVISNICGATVAERLACSPPTKAIRAQSPAGPLWIFACGNYAGGFYRGSLVYPAISFRYVSAGRRRNARAGETGHPRENPLDSHMQKSGGDPIGNRTRFALVGWVKDIVYQRTAQARKELLARIMHAATEIKDSRVQLRRASRAVHKSVGKKNTLRWRRLFIKFAAHAALQATVLLPTGNTRKLSPPGSQL